MWILKQLLSMSYKKQLAIDLLDGKLSVITYHLVKLHTVKADQTTKLYWQTEILEAFQQISDRTNNIKTRTGKLSFKDYYNSYKYELTTRNISNYIKRAERDWNKQSKNTIQFNRYSVAQILSTLSEIYKIIFNTIADTETWNDNFLLENKEYQSFSNINNGE